MALTGYEYSVPVVSILQSDGEYFKEAGTAYTATTASGETFTYYVGEVTVGEGASSSSYGSDYYTMSSFSSWGIPGSLTLKPEITAPGGNIYSVNGSVAGGTAYENMFGTSMAAPQITGMSALVIQYIEEEGLAETTGLSSRVLAQSLLMSTAVPLYEEESGGEYYSILKQGSGLANVGNAVTAHSYILMDENATASYADGKVKAELGDDPDKTGTYTFSFTINNLTDTDSYYALSADLFTQDVFEYYGDSYMDTWTIGLVAGATWTVDGVALEAAADLTGMDFNGDGSVNVNDAQALLDYATGAISEISNYDQADLDLDGDVDSYDAYLFLDALNTGYALVPASGSIEVTVTLSLSAGQKAALDADYPDGAYVEGFVYASELATSEGVEGTVHSIPVLAFYGSWTDSSMYDVRTYTQYKTGEETRTTHLDSTYSNYVTVQYAGLSGAYYLGANPLTGTIDEGTEDWVSLNSDATIYRTVYALIRNAAGGIITITDTDTGEVVYSQDLGQAYGAYYYVSGSAWYNTSTAQTVSYALSSCEEGHTYEISVTNVPEYYLNDDGTVDLESAGEGATLTLSFTLDDTAPTITGVEGDIVESDGTPLTVTATDNGYLAGIYLYDADGTGIATVYPSTAQTTTEDGSTWTGSFDVSELEDGVYYIQVYDYALNYTTYRVFVGVEPTDEVESLTLSASSLSLMTGGTASLTATVLPVNISNAGVTWTSSDESIVTVKDGVVTGVGEGTATVTAASVVDPTVTASCEVEVFTIEDTVNGLVWDEDGTRWWSEIDINAPSNYTKLSSSGATAVLWSAVVQDGTLYAADDELGFYSIDTEDDYAESYIGAGRIYFYDLAESYNYNGYAVAVYGPYVATVDVTTGDYIGAWNLNNYTSCGNLAGIAYCGSVYTESTGITRDYYYAISTSGNVYLFGLYINASGGRSMSYYSSPIAETGATASAYYYNSAYYSFDTGFLYFSAWNGSTNILYAIDADNSGEAYELGNFGDGVWPASGLFNLDDVGEQDADTEAIADLAEEMVEATADTAEIELIQDETSSKQPSGSLNVAVDANDEGGSEKPETTGTLTVNVTAKDAEGNEIAATNGIVLVTYDADAVTLDDVSVSGADLTSEVSSEGSLKLGYVKASGYAAGETIATLTFSFNEGGCDDADVTITYLETNNVHGEYAETVTFEHTYGEPVFTWSEDYSSATATVTCSVCGDTLTETAEVSSATSYEDAEITYTATVEIDGVTYTDTQTVEIVNPFTDVDADDYFYAPVLWAIDNGITTGSSDTTFSPYAEAERCQVVTFLWRAAGCPEVGEDVENPFTDVTEEDYFYTAVLWAVENGITTGTSDTTFSPYDVCERCQVVTFLYRYFGQPEVTATENNFTDVDADDYFYNAVLWAVENGSTTGTSDTTFSPYELCERCMVVTFLYRAEMM